MGSEIQITCNSCDVDITEEIGYGEVGIGIYVCVCDSCKVFATRKHNARLDGELHPKYRCGKCRKPLRIIAPTDDDSDDDDLSLGSCPICGGKLRGSPSSLPLCFLVTNTLQESQTHTRIPIPTIP